MISGIIGGPDDVLAAFKTGGLAPEWAVARRREESENASFA